MTIVSPRAHDPSIFGSWYNTEAKWHYFELKQALCGKNVVLGLSSSFNINLSICIKSSVLNHLELAKVLV